MKIPSLSSHHFADGGGGGGEVFESHIETLHDDVIW